MSMNVKKDFVCDSNKEKDKDSDKSHKDKILKESIKASDNMQKYLEKHSINIKIPTIQVEMSKIYKADSNYFLQVCRYNIPGDEDDNDEEDQLKWKKI